MRSFLFVAISLFPIAAHAQTRPAAIASGNGDGIDTHLFRPALDSRGFIAVNGADVLDAGHISLGLTLDYGRNLLRTAGDALVANSFSGTLHFDYGIANRAVVGVSAPAILMAGGQRTDVAGWGPQELDAQQIGSLALHGKLALTRVSSGLGIAAAVQVGVPVSDAPRNAGADPSLWYWPQIIVERRFGDHDQVRLALNGGYRGHAPSGTTLPLENGSVKDGNRLTYGAAASFRVLEPVDLVVETYGTYLLGSSDAAVRPSNEALAGIKVFVEKSSHLVIGAGPRYTNGFEAADFRGVIGFVFEPPSTDRDGDGIVDNEDACPDVPGVHSSDPAKNGCPPDSDDDGIADAQDACPYAKGPRTNDPRTNGCPVYVEKTPVEDDDWDKDGVANAVDACPRVKGDPHPEDPTRNGCPDILFGPIGITVFDKILFETNSAEILPASNTLLDKVAAALNDHLDLTLIEVAGHADERGSEQLNLRLTQARVDSVVVALVARNVDKSRLRSKGYGYYCPIVEGHDEEAWSKNRRVEFKIVKNSEGPTNAPLGCEAATKHGVIPAPVP